MEIRDLWQVGFEFCWEFSIVQRASFVCDCNVHLSGLQEASESLFLRSAFKDVIFGGEKNLNADIEGSDVLLKSLDWQGMSLFKFSLFRIIYMYIRIRILIPDVFPRFSRCSIHD